MGSEKVLVRRDGSRHELPAKVDNVEVEPGDRLVYVTAGGGGWGDPLARPVDAVLVDVVRGLATPEGALRGYGVVVDSAAGVDQAMTEAERERQRAARPAGGVPVFDFGRGE
jgi:N-methylhydantoinase B